MEKRTIWISYNPWQEAFFEFEDYETAEGYATRDINNLPPNIFQTIEKHKQELASCGFTYLTIEGDAIDIFLTGEKEAVYFFDQQKYWKERESHNNDDSRSVNPVAALQALDLAMQRVTAFIETTTDKINMIELENACQYLKGTLDENIKKGMDPKFGENILTITQNMALALNMTYQLVKKDLINTVPVNDAYTNSQRQNASLSGLDIERAKLIDDFLSKGLTKQQVVFNLLKIDSQNWPSESTIYKWVTSRQKTRGFKPTPTGRPKK